ncbi:MAG: pyruvate, phosphate dikinase [Deltaproteobacteria bacterium]|jgi:pyruvate,orthophosphate dikinase|nr:pyruvate, phosphate dikinase [Deltaproteobacteria bacterium]
MASKMVYSFGGSKTDGKGEMKNLLGGKGANLAEMCHLGMPVPPGFTITTEVCTAFYQSGKKFPKGLKDEVDKALARVEKIMGSKFGSTDNPLLVSCRSGARISMPGMMDTVLNIGLNDETLKALIAKTNNPRFAYDSYRRFVAMYGDVVMGVKEHILDKVTGEVDKNADPFGHAIDKLKADKGYKNDTELTADDLKGLVVTFKKIIKDVLNQPFPEDPREQLWGAIGAVFDSWMITRAKSYRKLHGIPEDWGTAVNVQAMVFGNMNDNSGTGVCFSRDPSTGENYFFGEYLINAQGEDVVAGIRTPKPINRQKPLPKGVNSTLIDDMPKIYKTLESFKEKLENHYRDMQDIEFTIEDGRLFMLQCRSGKRTGHAALKIATDLVNEKLITKQTAIARFDPNHMTQVLLPTFDTKSEAYINRQVLTGGLPASPGAAVGQAYFSAKAAEDEAAKGKKVILVRLETSPEDIKGMHASQGILTARGGMTSHAAVVARGMGRTCVAGAPITVDYGKNLFTIGDEVIKAGDWVSLDGTKGEVIKGQLPTKEVGLSDEFHTFMKWVEAEKVMKVRTNADTPNDSRVARSYGAEGIGLCRTEHMFFEADRIDHVRAMILANTQPEREEALSRILPMQREDFFEIFKAMDGFPVTIRTLDPPLHEFLPHSDHEIKQLAEKFSLPLQAVKDRIDFLHEQNPMLGLRGCRLGILYPEITSMQARAIFEAAVKATKEGIKVFPEIMIPLIGNEKEFAAQKALVDQVAKDVLGKSNVKLNYLVGTMIELPRAALVADKVVEAGAEFFSFGTNDLTQTTFGLSRDDSGIFLPRYLEQNIWETDPFVTIDFEGLGQLMEIGVQKGRSADKKLKIGICGEHGGDPPSVMFCYDLGFDYVSCSPFRVPLARLASAQASLKASPKDLKKKAEKEANPAKKPLSKQAEYKKKLAKKLAETIAPLANQALKSLKPMAKKVLPKTPAKKKPANDKVVKVTPKNNKGKPTKKG